MTWSARDLSFRYPGGERPAVAEVSLDLPDGSFTALLGPNGSGKSTLLRLLLGTLQPGSGTVEYGGRKLTDWSRAELAREIGVVPQGEEIAFPMTVREMVAMGRYPHLGPWRRESAQDRDAVDRAMKLCDVLSMRDRAISTLSGGERQRARIARALAQQPRVLALDEPTVALDVSHEMSIFELVRALGTSGVTVLLATHNLNLAARYAERLILMDAGRVVAHGEPPAVLERSLLERVYEWPLLIMQHPGPGPDAGAPQVTPLAQPSGSDLPAMDNRDDFSLPHSHRFGRE
jgi:iron complex transport system ATP-binding protein